MEVQNPMYRPFEEKRQENASYNFIKQLMCCNLYMYKITLQCVNTVCWIQKYIQKKTQTCSVRAEIIFLCICLISLKSARID